MMQFCFLICKILFALLRYLVFAMFLLHTTYAVGVVQRCGIGHYFRGG